MGGGRSFFALCYDIAKAKEREKSNIFGLKRRVTTTTNIERNHLTKTQCSSVTRISESLPLIALSFAIICPFGGLPAGAPPPIMAINFCMSSSSSAPALVTKDDFLLCCCCCCLCLLLKLLLEREKCRLDDVRNEEVDFVSEDCICCFVAILSL